MSYLRSFPSVAVNGEVKHRQSRNINPVRSPLVSRLFKYQPAAPKAKLPGPPCTSCRRRRPRSIAHGSNEPECASGSWRKYGRETGRNTFLLIKTIRCPARKQQSHRRATRKELPRFPRQHNNCILLIPDYHVAGESNFKDLLGETLPKPRSTSLGWSSQTNAGRQPESLKQEDWQLLVSNPSN